jgi:peptidyl-prolyl cis-trans isomerase-like 2
MKQADLIKVHFEKNDAGEYVDPVTYKVLTDNTHIIAIRHGDSANAFAYDTVERLNIKAKMWKDLLTDQDFTRKDIITLQDPLNLESRNLSDFKYLKDGEDAGIPKDEATINTSSLSNAAELKIIKAKEAVAKARAERQAATNLTKTDPKSKPKSSSTPISQSKAIPYNATRHTTGQAAASLTSTGLTPHTSASLALMTDEEYLLKPRRVRQKGYVTLTTTLGPITLELYPEHAPKAVWNFIRLAQKGYYNSVPFHRNIRNFMIQSGDPTGTGRGGSSIWGKNFQDEFEGPMKHDARGIVSMANKGKNTNSSQFFILYRQAKHLDRKHTIFGRVLDEESLAVLKVLEEVPVDDGDRPKEKVEIVEAKVLVDPFEEFMKDKKDSEEGKEANGREKGSADDDKTTWTGKRIRADGSVEGRGSVVGKYLKTASRHDDVQEMGDADPYPDPEPEPVRKKIKSSGFGNFDGW